jgi:aminoglycoside 3-N-acetyltransferase
MLKYPVMSTQQNNVLTGLSLRSDLRLMGLAPGHAVMVHAAVSKVGAVLGGPDTLIGALLDVIGPEGTLVAYTSWDGAYEDLLEDDGLMPLSWRDHVPGFDPLVSRAVRMNGILPEFIRTTPGAKRSGNPGASVAAIGQLSDWITADHPLDYGYGKHSPLARLVEAGGRVMMIGAPWDTMTLIHHADHLARIEGKLVRRYEVPFASERGTVWRFIEEFETGDPIVPGFPENYIEQVVTAYVRERGGIQGTVGGAAMLLVDAKPILAFAIEWLEQLGKQL